MKYLLLSISLALISVMSYSFAANLPVYTENSCRVQTDYGDDVNTDDYCPRKHKYTTGSRHYLCPDYMLEGFTCGLPGCLSRCNRPTTANMHLPADYYTNSLQSTTNYRIITHRVYFDTDSALISEAEQIRLLQLRPLSRNCRVLTIDGYADERSSKRDGGNDQLSRSRAIAIKNHLLTPGFFSTAHPGSYEMSTDKIKSDMVQGKGVDKTAQLTQESKRRVDINLICGNLPRKQIDALIRYYESKFDSDYRMAKEKFTIANKASDNAKKPAEYINPTYSKFEDASKNYHAAIRVLDNATTVDERYPEYQSIIEMAAVKQNADPEVNKVISQLQKGDLSSLASSFKVAYNQAIQAHNTTANKKQESSIVSEFISRQKKADSFYTQVKPASKNEFLFNAIRKDKVLNPILSNNDASASTALSSAYNSSLDWMKSLTAVSAKLHADYESSISAKNVSVQKFASDQQLLVSGVAGRLNKARDELEKHQDNLDKATDKFNIAVRNHQKKCLAIINPFNFAQSSLNTLNISKTELIDNIDTYEPVLSRNITKAEIELEYKRFLQDPCKVSCRNFLGKQHEYDIASDTIKNTIKNMKQNLKCNLETINNAPATK